MDLKKYRNSSGLQDIYPDLTDYECSLLCKAVYKRIVGKEPPSPPPPVSMDYCPEDMQYVRRGTHMVDNIEEEDENEMP